jgi:hypothetical protein
MFIPPFINQHLRTTLHALNHTLVTALSRIDVYWHHLQVANNLYLVGVSWRLCQQTPICDRSVTNVWFSTHIVVYNCWLISGEPDIWFRNYVAVACGPVANFLRRGTCEVQLCSGVSPCGSVAKKWRMFKKFGKGKFVKSYILQIPKILYSTVLCFIFSLNKRRIPWSSFHLFLDNSACFLCLVRKYWNYFFYIHGSVHRSMTQDK